MKKLFLPLLLLLISFSFASAQTFSVSKTQATHNIYANSTTLDDTVAITNLTANTMTLVWERVVVSEPGGWTTWVCDDVLCHPPSKDTDEWDITGNGSSYISLHVNPGTNVGPGEIQIILTEKANPQNTITITWTIDAAVGMEDYIVNPLTLYPNPVTEQLFFDWEGQNFGQVSVELLNASGQVVRNEKVAAGSQIGVADLPKGLYFARVYADDEVMVRKFIKQ